MRLNPDTELIAILGDPVSHSLSPRIHNEAFSRLELNFAYLAFGIPPKSLGDALSALKTFQFRGANVTIPHKREVIFFLDELTETAEAVGAVNTIVRRGDGPGAVFIGDNTDVSGFLRPLKAKKKTLEDQEALVWGSGGSARAVVYALLNELKMSRVHLVCRSEENGRALARLFDPETERIDVVKWDYAALSMQQSTLVVNTTPLGMVPDVLSSPCLHPELIRDDHIVYDLVYRPESTSLLRAAAEGGATAIGGLDMLLGQAAASFFAWTGQEMPVEEIRKSLAED